VGNTNNRVTSKAFTIVELMIVIVVIGILAAITVVGYNGVINNANDKSVQTDLAKIEDAIKVFNLDNNFYPSSLNDISVAMAKSTIALSRGSYNVDTTVIANHNIDYCYSGVGTGYTVIAMSKSKNIFYTSDSSGGVKKYAGSWTSTAPALCTVVAPTSTTYYRGYAPDDTVTGPWRSWTGVGTTTMPTITNFITNPSFEVDTTGWGATSGVTIASSTDFAFSGTKSVKVTPSSSTYSGLVLSTPGTNGTAYTYSAYVYSVTPQTINFAADNMGINTAVTVGPSWQRITLSGTQINSHPLYVRAVNANGPVFYVDGVMFIQGSVAYGYADGYTTSWKWNGTINGSSSTGPAQTVSN
jgi:prepilin-type N-terminal cleavage/methylation domain-containing protein